MIIVQNAIVSDDIFLQKFCCDVERCKGACCVEGDAGAPLEEAEIGILEDALESVLPLMTEEGMMTVQEKGVFDYDEEGQFVTPLNNGKECAFTYFESGIAFCAIEKAFYKGDITFRKPVSCHLYPIRISKTSEGDAVNYHSWIVCKPAREKGKEKGIPVYRFCKDALIRKYGSEWYELLCKQIKELY